MHSVLRLCLVRSLTWPREPTAYLYKGATSLWEDTRVYEVCCQLLYSYFNSCVTGFVGYWQVLTDKHGPVFKTKNQKLTGSKYYSANRNIHKGSTVIFATNFRTLSRLRYATPTRSQFLKTRPLETTPTEIYAGSLWL